MVNFHVEVLAFEVTIRLFGRSEMELKQGRSEGGEKPEPSSAAYIYVYIYSYPT